MTALLAVVAAGVLAACGSSAVPAAVNPPSASAVTTPTAATPTITGGSSTRTPMPTRRASLVAAAHWTDTPEGPRLHVEPSRSGRARASNHVSRALDEALKAAGPQPLELTPSIRRSLENQLKCHAVFARFKATWNLETWRPDVGYTKTVLAACNP